MEELTITPEPIHDYCVAHSSSLDPLFDELSRRTLEAFPHVAHMQVGALEGNFLRSVVEMAKVYRVLEFGTFTGFSSLVFAMTLPDEGKITTLDRDPKATAIAREFWKQARVDHKVELLLGDGHESVKTLLKEVQSGTRRRYDLAFIDADKAGYDDYFEASIQLLRKGGIIITDNVLWSGTVLNPQDASDRTICAYNEKLKNDPRIKLVMLPVRDGITLAIIQ